MRRLLTAALLVAGLLPAAPATQAAAAPARPHPDVVPVGFTDSVVTSQAITPVALRAMPDGRVLVALKGGWIRVIQNGALVPAPALFRTVCQQSERGMLGVAVDPAFGQNGQVYVYYTRPASAPGGCVNRVSRFTMAGNVIDSASEVVLLDNISSVAGNHNGGDLDVGNDGFLYVSVGDAGCDPRGDSGCDGSSPSNNAAQDLSLLNGKILRVDRFSGAPAPGNPFSGIGSAACRVRGNTPSTPTSPCQEIFAYGLRNPWRFAFDPNTGSTRFYINDVGQNTREEVDLGIAGANYGWPFREGQCAQGTNPGPSCGVNPPQFVGPITDYPHGTGDYITGASFVPNGAWQSMYDGGYLFADGSPGRIFFKPAVGSTVYGNPFALVSGGISDIQFVLEPAGWALYYVNPSTNEVRAIRYNTPAPTAPGPLAFAPVTPSRVFDTRNLGADSGPMRAGTSRMVNVVATQGTHRAALVNITFVRPTATGYLSVWQPYTTRTLSSVANGEPGAVSANASVVPIDSGGNMMLFSSANAHVVVDLLGFFDTTAAGQAQAGRFTPVTPVRAVDTRSAPDIATNNYTRAPDGAESVVTVPIAGAYGVGSAVNSVVLIVTALSDSSPSGGWVTVYRHGAATPASSNLNTNGSGDRRANLVVVPVGSGGSVDLRLHGVANVIVDVAGSFTDATAALSATGTYVPIAVERVVDTRQSLGFGRLAASGTGTIDPPVVPVDALGVTQNLVMVNTSGLGSVTAYPFNTLSGQPTVSNVNATGAGQVRAAMAITALASGKVSYFASAATDLVVDVSGYFVGPTM